jgi:peptidoglycan/xylan/chitin deacetylase (PgdA/CDA1 family)
MRGIMKQIFVFIALCGAGLVVASRATLQAENSASRPQQEIAVTFDDLPLNGRDVGLASLQQMTDKLTTSIQSHQIPAVAFVNEKKLLTPGEIDARTALLAQWLQRGIELGNHTFSHPSFQTTPIEDFEDDVVRGENVTRILLAQRGMKLRYFRFPFLHTGPSLEIKREFEDFLARHHYTNAPVTIENSDWMFSALYTKAKLGGDQETADRIAVAYLTYTKKQFDFFEKFSVEVLGYEPPQVLLLHANWLNADHFDEVAGLLGKRGYRFITLEQALADKAYSLPDNYAGPMGVSWIERWAFSKGMEMRVKDEPDPPEFILKAYKAETQSR